MSQWEFEEILPQWTRAFFELVMHAHISECNLILFTLLSLEYMQSVAKKFSLFVTFSWMKQQKWKIGFCSTRHATAMGGWRSVCITWSFFQSLLHRSRSPTDLRIFIHSFSHHTLDTVPIGTWRIFNGFLMVYFKKFNGRWIFAVI